MGLFQLTESMESIPDPFTQKQLILENLKQQMAVDQSWYLLDSKWYKTFKQYVGIEDPASIGVDHPGTIDNSPLFSDHNPNEIKDDLVEQLDYVLVPEEVWKLLVEWYGIESERSILKREVVEYGIFTKCCKVEIYPVNLRLCKDFDYDNEHIYKFSIADSIGKIEKVMRSLFNVPSNVDTRLWSCFSTNAIDLLNKVGSTIQDEGLYQNQLVVIETRKEDGNWNGPPNRFLSSQAGTLTNGRDAGDKRKYTSSAITSLMKHENKSQRVAKPGLCGLSNLGNTCFMNSVIQCMSNCPPIASYFMKDEHLRELNVRNPLGMRGEIAKAFASLIKSMWSGEHTHTTPHKFKLQVGRFAPQFSGYQQHDSQELLTFLLDGLHEDLNRVREKPYIQMKPEKGKTDEEMAAEAWRNYKKRNDSIIVDLFHGLLKSTVVCAVCNTTSVTFDPFCYLSLPLPSLKTRQIQVLFFPLKEELKPMKYTVEVPKNGTVQDVVNRLGILRGASPRSFIVTEVINHHFHKIFSNEELLEGIENRDNIYVYEVPLVYEPRHIIPVYMWESDNTNLYANNLFGYPLLISIKKTECTYNTLYDHIWRKVCQYYWFSNEKSEDLPSTSHARNRSGSVNDADECDNNPEESLFSLYLIHKGAIKADVIKMHNDNKLIHFPDTFGSSYIAAMWHPRDVKTVHLDIDSTEKSGTTKSYSDTKSLHLRDCLELYTATEVLSSNDAWYCPLCKTHQSASKKFDLWTLPNILIIHLKRFSYSASCREKIDTMVNFPIKNLDMSEYVINKHHPNVHYDLFGVCAHYGGMGGGHYTAFCQNKTDNNWYLFDDMRVSSATERDVISRSAYVLFYKVQEQSTSADASDLNS